MIDQDSPNAFQNALFWQAPQPKMDGGVVAKPLEQLVPQRKSAHIKDDDVEACNPVGRCSDRPLARAIVQQDQFDDRPQRAVDFQIVSRV
jgi:hypothetical protein